MPVLLVDGHLVFLETEVGDALPKDADQEIVRELVLIGEVNGRDSLKPFQEACVGIMTPRDGRERVVGEPVIIAVVAEGGRALRKIAEIRFVLLVEKSVLDREAFGKRFGLLRKSGGGCGDSEKEDLGNAHRMISVNQRNQRVNTLFENLILGGAAALQGLETPVQPACLQPHPGQSGF